MKETCDENEMKKVFGKSACTGVAASAIMAAALLADMSRAHAADIRLLSAAAMQTVLKGVTDDFERKSGHKVIITYATMGAITQRMLRGESTDVVIGSTQSMVELVTAGKIDADSQATIAKVGIGVVVPTGTPKPRITSIEEFKDTLLAAKLIVYADPAGGGAAGIHIARVIEKLGIWDQVRPKVKYGAGGDVTEVTLAQGPGAVGMTQISEIVGKPGAELIGPLPEEVQNYTGVTVGTPTAAEPSGATTELIRFLRGPTVAAQIKARGMQTE
jgi:molybdate transport system substrate-binding protein